MLLGVAGSCVALPIHPLPQFESDLKEYLKEKADREAYEHLNAPKTIVVRFGYLRMVGEFPHTGKEKPGCGSKLVVRTNRGTEIGEMLTSTCQNSGCSKSVTRKEMLSYIENSGGRQYPFFELGRVLRIATVDDLNEQRRLDARKPEMLRLAKEMVARFELAMSVIEVEPILGNERVVIYFGAEDRVDFRDLVSELSRELGTKVELRQIGARDEARITADYERCGQYCCCKSFLKVLKPVSMKSAKVQKATLDPLKISGRCGRLMCCLRYEDETYEALRKNLPHRKTRVGTPEGDGIVISTQILTQLALVRLDNNTDVAIPIEDLCEPDSKTAPEPTMRRGRAGGGSGGRSGSGSGSAMARNTKRRDRGDEGGAGSSGDGAGDAGGAASGSGGRKRKRRRRRSRQGAAGDGLNQNQEQNREQAVDSVAEAQSTSTQGEAGGPTKKKRRRRRRNRGRGDSTGTVSGTGGGAAETGSSVESASGSVAGPVGSTGSGTGSGGGSGAGSSRGDGAGEPMKKKRRRRRRRRSTGGENTGNGPASDGGDSS